MTSVISGDGLQLLARLLAFATAIPFHEAAHAFVSDKLGDPTARNLGRLTLNPIKHLDLWGMIAMVTIGIGWAKPVPVNPNFYKNKKYGMALTAAAGPISNLILAYINMVLYKIVVYGWHVSSTGATAPAAISFIANILFYLAIINVNLAVFNMLPVPPFDGSRIFGLFLPEEVYFKVMQYERYLMFVMLGLLMFGVFTGVLQAANTVIINLLDKSTGYIDWIFTQMMA